MPQRPSTPTSRRTDANATKLNSTPYAKGTASSAAHNNESRAGDPLNIKLMKEDAKKTDYVSFIVMLKAFLTIHLMGDNEEVDDGVRGRADGIFNEILNASVNFANSDKEKVADRKTRTRAEYVKSRLKTYAGAQTENARYGPLCEVMNAILVEFESSAFTDLPAVPPEQNLIFMTNDPMVIESRKLNDDSSNTKRKPDIIALSQKTIGESDDEIQDFKLEDFANELSGTNAENLRNKVGETMTWLKVRKTMELKFNKAGADTEVLDEKFVAETVLKQSLEDEATNQPPAAGCTLNPQGRESSTATPVSGTKSATASQPPAAVASQSDAPSTIGDSNQPTPAPGSNTSASGKRKKQNGVRTNPNMRKNIVSSATKKPRTGDAPSLLRISPDVQCGYYAMEELRSRWNRTHTFVTLLEDEWLSLQRYDMHGCIATHSINILSCLPLFVAMVVILQRFNERMWGYRDIKLPCRLRESAGEPSTGCIGRNTFTCPAHCPDPSEPPETTAGGPSSGYKTRAATAAAVDNSRTEPSFEQCKHFFKVAWPEDERDKEPAIIRTTYERAEEYLGPLGEYVTQHLPVVKHSGEVPASSTAIFRKVVYIDTDDSRSLFWMVSERLEPLAGTKESPCDPKEFWCGLWQLIRCHYLLWQIGIAHGDISINNLMRIPVSPGSRIRAVLNDFDLAAIMKPGDSSPKKQGFERTGTLPFMAVQLLQNPEGDILRCYHHDLESFAWCLFWQAKKDPFPDDAIRGTFKGVSGAKLDMLGCLKSTHLREDHQFLWDFILEWMDYVGLRERALLNNPPTINTFVGLVDQHPEAKAVLREESVDDRRWVSYTAEVRPAPAGSQTAAAVEAPNTAVPQAAFVSQLVDPGALENSCRVQAT